MDVFSLLSDNNVIKFLIAIIPSIFYAIVLFINMPKGSVYFWDMKDYLMKGFFSGMLVVAFWYVFPLWYTPIGNSQFQIHLFNAFIQVSLIEEVSKWLTYQLSEIGQKKTNWIRPFFHAIMISLGFAILENVHHLIAYNEFVLFSRAFTAIVMHIITGTIIGFFGAITLMNPQFSFIKKLIINITGLFCAILLHGIYDFNLFYNNGENLLILIFLIVFSTIIGIFLSRKLFSKHYKKDI